MRGSVATTRLKTGFDLSHMIWLTWPLLIHGKSRRLQVMTWLETIVLSRLELVENVTSLTSCPSIPICSCFSFQSSPASNLALAFWCLRMNQLDSASPVSNRTDFLDDGRNCFLSLNTHHEHKKSGPENSSPTCWRPSKSTDTTPWSAHSSLGNAMPWRTKLKGATLCYGNCCNCSRGECYH